MEKGGCCTFSPDELGQSNLTKVEKASRVMAGSQVLRTVNHSQETKAKTLHPKGGACSHQGALNPPRHHAHPRHEETEGSKAWRGNETLSSPRDSAGCWKYLLYRCAETLSSPEANRARLESDIQAGLLTAHPCHRISVSPCNLKEPRVTAWVLALPL